MTKLGNCTVWWNHQYMNIGTLPIVKSSMSTRRVPKDLQICPKIWSNISPLFGWSHTLITILQTMLHMSHAVVIFRADDDVLQPASCGADEDIFPAWWELCWDIVGRDIVNGDNGQRWPSSSECVCYRTHTDALCHKLCMRHFSRGQCRDIGAAGKGENPCFIPL